MDPTGIGGGQPKFSWRVPYVGQIQTRLQRSRLPAGAMDHPTNDVVDGLNDERSVELDFIGGIRIIDEDLNEFPHVVCFRIEPRDVGALRIPAILPAQRLLAVSLEGTPMISS